MRRRLIGPARASRRSHNIEELMKCFNSFTIYGLEAAGSIVRPPLPASRTKPAHSLSAKTAAPRSLATTARCIRLIGLSISEAVSFAADLSTDVRKCSFWRSARPVEIRLNASGSPSANARTRYTKLHSKRYQVMFSNNVGNCASHTPSPLCGSMWRFGGVCGHPPIAPSAWPRADARGQILRGAGHL